MQTMTLSHVHSITTGLVAIDEQHWTTDRGPRAQLALTVAAPVTGALDATVRACHGGPTEILRELGGARTRATRSGSAPMTDSASRAAPAAAGARPVS